VGPNTPAAVAAAPLQRREQNFRPLAICDGYALNDPPQQAHLICRTARAIDSEAIIAVPSLVVRAGKDVRSIDAGPEFTVE